MSPPKMTELFVDCQRGINAHGKLVKSLTQIYDSTPLDDFWEEFLRHVKRSFVVFKREPAVERTLEFVAKFATSLHHQSRPAGGNQEEASQNSADNSDDENSEMHPFLQRFFTFLLKHHNARDKGVRFRCCQMINKLLLAMGEDALIDDDLYDQIYECMLQRLRDRFPLIRVQAVLAVSRLQEPQNIDCPIIEAYLFLMSRDNNHDVRRAVLSCIAASSKTLKGILERTHDAREEIRKLAYQVIAEKIHIRALTIAQRVHLLSQGLKDRSPSVKDTCTNQLLQTWLKVYQGNILDLLKCLDVENSLDTCELMLGAIFKKSPPSELVQNFDLLDDSLVVPWEKLTCENATYWRCLCEHVKSLGVTAEEQLDRILPNGKQYSTYLAVVVKKMETEEDLEEQLIHEFILQQLLNLAQSLDFSDEVGRQELRSQVQSLLANEKMSHVQVKPLLGLYRQLVTDASAQINNLTEIISDIRQPIRVVENKTNEEEQRKINVKLAGVRVELNQLREELDECIKNQDFGRAAEIKFKVTELETSKQDLLDQSLPQTQEIREEKNDPKTLLKCLTIAWEMLEFSSVTNLTPTLQSLIEALILPGIQNPEPVVRNAALHALGLCCLLNKDTARSHLLLFIQASQMDQETVQRTALKIVFDMLHTFGLETFEVRVDDLDASQVEGPEFEATVFDEDEDGARQLDNSTGEGTAEVSTEEKAGGNTAAKVLNILLNSLDSKSSDLRTVCGEGLAKLLISGRVVSAKLMSRLLITWYNPVTEDDTYLRHCLGAFFPIFAFAGKANQLIMQEAVLPTLRTLFNAPATSPLVEVNTDNVADLLCHLTNHNFLVNKQVHAGDVQDVNPHDNLAVKLSNEILGEPNSFNVRTLCKMLTSLNLTAGNNSGLKELKVLGERMLKEVKDKQCSKILEKYQRSVKDQLRSSHQASLGSVTDGGDSQTEGPTELLDETLRSTADGAGDGNKTQTVGSITSVDGGPGDGPEPSTSRLSPASQTTTGRGKPRLQSLSENDLDHSVFSTPTPLRRTTRARKAKKVSADDPRINLEELLSDPDPDSQSEQEPLPHRSEKKGRVTRATKRRSPLGHIQGPHK